MKMMYQWYKNEFLGWKKKQYNCFKKFHFIMHSLKKLVLNALKTDLLHEFPFYNKWIIKQESKAFKRYARIYKVEIVDSKDVSAQLEASKLS